MNLSMCLVLPCQIIDTHLWESMYSTSLVKSLILLFFNHPLCSSCITTCLCTERSVPVGLNPCVYQTFWAGFGDGLGNKAWDFQPGDWDSCPNLKWKKHWPILSLSSYVPIFPNIYKTSMLNANHNIWSLNLNGYFAYCPPKKIDTMLPFILPRWRQNIQERSLLQSCSEDLICNQKCKQSCDIEFRPIQLNCQSRCLPMFYNTQ